MNAKPKYPPDASGGYNEVEPDIRKCCIEAGVGGGGCRLKCQQEHLESIYLCPSE